jgi:adenosylhomocysteine nucleosidase
MPIPFQQSGSFARVAAAFLKLFLTALLLCPAAHATDGHCLSECTRRIGIVSAFGREAELLLAETKKEQVYTINGNRFTIGSLRGNPVVIVLSGYSMINATLVTQMLVDHFNIERLIMSGIAGGVNPARHIGDVIVPQVWAMPMEVYWNHDGTAPTPCGAPGELSCLHMKLTKVGGQTVPPFALPGKAATGLFVRDSWVLTSANAPQAEYRFDYEVDAEMYAVAGTIRPSLLRCSPKAAPNAGAKPDPGKCVASQPALVLGGRGLSATMFLANDGYRQYLADALQGQCFDMETAGLAHVAYANHIPFIAFRSLSDLAGAQTFNPDVTALLSSGLAEANEAAVTLTFLEAWAARGNPLAR